MNFARSSRRSFALLAALPAALLAGAGSALLGTCGPFTDVSDDAFCPFVLEIFTLGITTGTTPTTYDPTGTVTRLQMAAFLSRSVDGVLRRGGRRAALNRFWSRDTNASLFVVTVGSTPRLLACDGEDVWVGIGGASSVARVHASDGRLLETWTGASMAGGLLSASGRIFATGLTSPGSLYLIDPSLPAGAVTTVASDLGANPRGIAYDGSSIWTSNFGSSVSIVTPGATIPWTVTTVTAGFAGPAGIAFDGANMWVSNGGSGTIVRLDGSGAVLQTVTVGTNPQILLFDGTNLWVPNVTASSVSIVRASNGVVLATLTGNGLNGPLAGAFDGQRVLITNATSGADSVSLWKAADLSPIGAFGAGPGSSPFGACSDGIHFWVALTGAGLLARF